MTKKDYELIAGTLQEALNHTDISQSDYKWLCEAFAINLRKREPRFDRNKFLKACGIEAPKTKTFIGLGGAVWTVPDED